MILSPSTSSRLSTLMPLQNVPFVEPRSSTIILSPSRLKAQCSRDTPSSFSRTPTDGPRPTTVFSFCSLNISPALTPARTTRYARLRFCSRSDSGGTAGLVAVVSSFLSPAFIAETSSYQQLTDAQRASARTIPTLTEAFAGAGSAVDAPAQRARRLRAVGQADAQRLCLAQGRVAALVQQGGGHGRQDRLVRHECDGLLPAELRQQSHDTRRGRLRL